MMSTLVMYFSKTGHTRERAQVIAQKLQADLYEIKEEVPYGAADLNWNNPASRCNREQEDEQSRPAYQGVLPDVSRYDCILIGHPIWWGRPPRIIDTVLEQLHLQNSGKTLASFATSGGSTYAQSQAVMTILLGSSAKRGRVLSNNYSIDKWLEENRLLS
ncbi:flavodoxin [Streptococcus sp. H31]|uniref:flavodoxin n=1 Tax=Streptococcus huangxiaojuni TaxID=3237239 RepID=UPI0034A3DD52